MAKKNILIVAGEPSGDLHASNLVKDLLSLDPSLKFFGLGGNLSKNAGVDIEFDISKLALVGFTEVLKNIFIVGKAFKAILARVDRQRPDLAILVDYPGFNLRLAGQLKKRAIPVVYYISPQIWAWGRGRVGIIKRCVDKVIVFFKFEEELYKTYGISAEFVGHPLLDAVKVTSSRSDVLKKYRLSEGKTTIALLPGSRVNEIKSLLNIMVSSANIISEKLGNIQFIIAKYPALPRGLYEETLKDCPLDMRIAEGDAYNVLAASDFAIVASGTATLEAGIIGTPLVIIYKTNIVTYLLYRLVTTTSFIGIVNVIASKEVAPELLQFDATPEKIAAKSVEILADKDRVMSIRRELNAVKACLGAPGARERAARAILPFLSVNSA